MQKKRPKKTEVESIAPFAHLRWRRELKRKLTGHRILTSDEITFNKRKDKEDKENQ